MYSHIKITLSLLLPMWYIPLANLCQQLHLMQEDESNVGKFFV
jgi:hypothetical protein